MCLGVPGQITETWQHETTGLAMGKVSFSGIGKEVCLSCVPDAEVGDYVVVHVGFAISKVDEEEAKQEDPSPEPTHEEKKHHFLKGLFHRGD